LIQINVLAPGPGPNGRQAGRRKNGRIGPAPGEAVFDSTRELLAICAASRQGGKDFPTIWRDILKGHPAVLGIPATVMIGGESVLAIPLITGERLVFGDKGFSID
jgi:hypothetical protein